MFCMTGSWLKKSLGGLEFSILNLKDLKLKSLLFFSGGVCPDHHISIREESRK